MTIVRTTYRYKRPPRKRKPNPAALTMPTIVHAKKPKPRKLGDPPIRRTAAAGSGPAPPPANDDHRLVAQTDEANGSLEPTQQRKSTIVTIRRRKRVALGQVPDMTPEEHKRRGDAADALWRDMKRRIAVVVDGGVNPRKSSAGGKVGTKIAVEPFEATGLGR